MIDSTRAGIEQQRIEKELIDVLADMQLVQDAGRRQLFMIQLRRHGPFVTVTDYGNPRDQAVEIITSCLRAAQIDALAALAEVVRLFEPHGAPLGTIERLRHEWNAIEFLLDDDWVLLRPALTSVELATISRLYERAFSHGISAPPAWCVSAWDLFLYLADQNSPAHGIPPSMHLLVFLEQEVDSQTVTAIRRRNSRLASDTNLTRDLDRRRAEVNAGTELPEPFVYLVIQVEPDLEPDVVRTPADDRYTVSHYRQWHDGHEWRTLLKGRQPGIKRAGLESTVEQIVRSTEIDWFDRRAEVILELILPLQLINEDVAWWCKEAASAYLEAKVLAMDYPVVVRSLERLRHPDWHRQWRRRWREMRATPGLSVVHRSEPAGDAYFVNLEAILADDAKRAALVLSAPPTEETPVGLREITTALRAGVPVIIWHRRTGSDPAFWEEIREMTAGGRILGLPIHARKSRLAALRLDNHHQDLHFGRHLVVLWDDPDRMPESGGSVPAIEAIR